MVLLQTFKSLKICDLEGISSLVERKGNCMILGLLSECPTTRIFWWKVTVVLCVRRLLQSNYSALNLVSHLVRQVVYH